MTQTHGAFGGVSSTGAGAPADQTVGLPRLLLSTRRVDAVDAAEYHPVFLDVLFAADLLVVGAAGVLGFYIRYQNLDLSFDYWAMVVIGTILAGNYTHLFRVYLPCGILMSNLQFFGAQFRKMAMSWLLTMATVLVIVYFAKASDNLSRLWFSYWFAFAAVGFAATRLVLATRLSSWRRQGRLSLDVAIVGPQTFALELAERWSKTQPTLSRRVVGVFRDPSCCDGTDAGAATVDDLVRRARRNRIDEVFVALPTQPGQGYGSLLRKLRMLPANVCLCFDIPQVPSEGLPPCKPMIISGLVVLNVSKPPLAGWKIIIKRLEDIVLGSLALLLFAPFMLFVAILIKLESDGPVLFRQRRFGFNNDPFEIYKFRTMYHRPEDGDFMGQARRNDPRVTRLGRVLRRASVDELPQLINVIQGRMSLVGPRPHPIALNEQYAAIIDDYPGRHRVKPGITGWAQVNGLRGETDILAKMRDRIAFDLFYIENWSLLFDLKILCRTALVGFFHRNAY